MKILFSLLLVSLLFSFPRARAEEDVLAKLSALPGVQAKETTVDEDRKAGLRRFAILIEQPADHFAEGSLRFQQKLVLFHRDFNEPMVLQTSGYVIFGERLSRIAQTFATNQIQVEHRFFADSAPNPKDWSLLTVRQSAEDFHRIVTTFKGLYAKNWVNTGASKGGMTSLYHRFFYPNDLNGTVADVAPNSFSTEDQRYVDFVDQVGGERYADCRARLYAFQQQVLDRRQEVLPFITGNFNFVSKDMAFEYAVIELPFVFWQYGNPQDEASGCGAVPSMVASGSALADFVKAANDPDGYTDGPYTTFQPYVYQAAAELGGPASRLIHLWGRLHFRYGLEPLLPKDVVPAYSDQIARAVAAWVSQSAKEVMFVYGEYDPWTAGAFRDQKLNADNHWYEVKAGNHGANFLRLEDGLKKEATQVIARWLGKDPSSEVQMKPMLRRSKPAPGLYLEDLELERMRNSMRN